MPRNVRPDDLKAGSGKRVPPKGTTLILTGPGMPGSGPNIGEISLPAWVRAQDSLSAGLSSHVNALKGAHPASAIFLEEGPETLPSLCVQGAINDLAGAIPRRPPYVGEWEAWSGLMGVPDWGTLKLNDEDLQDRGLLTTVNNTGDVYPYFYEAPSPAIGGPFAAFPGGDPASDWMWNSGVGSGTLEGSGGGDCYAGAFTRDGTAPGQEMMRTDRISPRTSVVNFITGRPKKQAVTLSGVVYPADRGVLAIIHWPAGTTLSAPTVSDFLAQDPLDRVVAAILLGQGLTTGAPCVTGACDTLNCDGGPGGIFGVGADASGNYDPYAYPGRASGQYDLQEIHRGISAHDGTALVSPWDDLDGDTNPGAQRALNGTVPAPGQVRWGTDPLADSVVGTLSYGIPILGGSTYAYNPVPAPALGLGHRVVGQTAIQTALAIGAGEQNNFFRYRLPYLKDYSTLKWTPQGEDPLSTKESFRYFDIAPLNAGTEYSGGPVVTSLTTAGNYGTPFSEDHWAFQIARYRHTFLMPSTEATGDFQEAGSYWLVHFKKEADFEAFARDGVMPWDATDGYEIYNATLLNTGDLEADANIVNEVTSTSTFAPRGPAPAYGYPAPPYHALRSTVALDANTPAFPAVTAEFDWAASGVGMTWVSGVAYFTPRNNTTGADNMVFSQMSIASAAATAWADTYRVDDEALTSGVAPAKISSANPATITFFPFAYAESPTQPGSPSAIFPLGVPGVTNLSAVGANKLPSRVEVPFIHCGDNASGDYGEANGPERNDDFLIFFGAPSTITFEGDEELPAFTTEAIPRVFFRRPIGHAAVTTSALPYTANDGHGEIVAPSDGAQILYHSTSWDAINAVGAFGNYDDGTPAPRTGNAPQYIATKDTWERFLDETYRYLPTFDDGSGNGIKNIAGYGVTTPLHLAGPGMAGWFGGPIEVPARAGLSTSYGAGDWGYTSWIGGRYQENDLSNAGAPLTYTGLQVVGWPDRNPPISDGGTAPVPSSGLLIYPQDDYTTAAVRPEQVADALANPQPDYSAVTNDRNYVRCLDAAFVVSGTPEDVSGTSFVTLRIDGVTLESLAYTAPGPGRLSSNAIAVMIKIPGITTWMDVGRRDGDGPSKQDAFADGAGCQVVGPETYDGRDPQSGLVYCQIKCHVGPVATLFLSTGIGGVPVGESPVLVKVLMGAGASDYNMDREYNAATGNFTGTAGRPGVSSEDVRGLSGIRVLRLSEL